MKLETLSRLRHGNKKYLYLVELYKEQHDVETVTLDAVTDWAIKEGHYIPEPVDQRKILKREIARAMRTDYFVDDQGREVRKYHSVRHTDGEKSWSEWATLKNADPGHMRVSFSNGDSTSCLGAVSTNLISIRSMTTMCSAQHFRYSATTSIPTWKS